MSSSSADSWIDASSTSAMVVPSSVQVNKEHKGAENMSSQSTGPDLQLEPGPYFNWADEVEDQANLPDSTSSDCVESCGGSFDDIADTSFEEEIESFEPDESGEDLKTNPTIFPTEEAPTNLKEEPSEDWYIQRLTLTMNSKEKTSSPTVKRINMNENVIRAKWASHELFKPLIPVVPTRAKYAACARRLSVSITEDMLLFRAPHDNLEENLRTIVITGIAPGTTTTVILSRLRGGKVVRVVVCDTKSITGTFTGIVEFADSHAVLTILNFYRAHSKIIEIVEECQAAEGSIKDIPRINSARPSVDNQPSGSCSQKAIPYYNKMECAFVNTPTMPKWNGLHLFDSVTRCIEVTCLHLVAKAQLAMDFGKDKMHDIGLESVVFDEASPDTVILRFTSMFAAKSAINHIRAKNSNYSGVHVVYSPDPCAAEIDDIFKSGNVGVPASYDLEKLVDFSPAVNDAREGAVLGDILVGEDASGVDFIRQVLFVKPMAQANTFEKLNGDAKDDVFGGVGPGIHWETTAIRQHPGIDAARYWYSARETLQAQTKAAEARNYVSANHGGLSACSPHARFDDDEDNIPLFTQVKETIGDVQRQADFDKLLNMYMAKQLDKDMLIRRVNDLIGHNETLMNHFKYLIKHAPGEDNIPQGPVRDIAILRKNAQDRVTRICQVRSRIHRIHMLAISVGREADFLRLCNGDQTSYAPGNHVYEDDYRSLIQEVKIKEEIASIVPNSRTHNPGSGQTADNWHQSDLVLSGLDRTSPLPSSDPGWAQEPFACQRTRDWTPTKAKVHGLGNSR